MNWIPEQEKRELREPLASIFCPNPRSKSGPSLTIDTGAAQESNRGMPRARPAEPNHFHLVVETSNANLVAGMRWFPSPYTSRFNRRHKLFGHLFGGR